MACRNRIKREYERKRESLKTLQVPNKAGHKDSQHLTVLACSAASDIKEATRQGSLAGVQTAQEEAARKVIGTLISALKDFVAGVSKAAGFFTVMEQELKKL